MLGKSDRGILRAGALWFAPGLALDYMARHAIDFWLTTEDLPHPSNRITVDRRDAIHLSKTYSNTEPHKRLLGKLKDLLGPLGCQQAMIPRSSVLSQQIPVAGIAHNAHGGDDQRQARPRAPGDHMTTVADHIGRGLVAGLAGTAAMTVSSTVEARLRGRAPSSAPARATAKVLGIKAFEDGVAQARFNDLSHWGYGTAGASCAGCWPPRDCRPRPPRSPTARPSTAPPR